MSSRLMRRPTAVSMRSANCGGCALLSGAGTVFKIYILDEAHQITDAAFNALLKTRRSPPATWSYAGHDQPEDIPQTIVSRLPALQLPGGTIRGDPWNKLRNPWARRRSRPTRMPWLC